MLAFGDFHFDPLRTMSCEALADGIISGIPALAEAHDLPSGQVALTVWLALFCDLVGVEAKEPMVDELFALARCTHACSRSDCTVCASLPSTKQN